MIRGLFSTAIRGTALGIFVAEARSAGNLPLSIIVLLAVIVLFLRDDGRDALAARDGNRPRHLPTPMHADGWSAPPPRPPHGGSGAYHPPRPTR